MIHELQLLSFIIVYIVANIIPASEIRPTAVIIYLELNLKT